MNPETLTEVWNWLLGLSKVQLIMLGGGVALLVAVSKFLRFVFLVIVLLLVLATFLPQLFKNNVEHPVPTAVQHGQHAIDSTQDTSPPVSPH